MAFFVTLYRADAYGSLFDHVLSWWKQRNDPNIFFLTYEDIIKVRKYVKPFKDREA